jgi:Acetyltransferase (GNAT) domain
MIDLTRWDDGYKEIIMTTSNNKAHQLRIDLGDGLVLRRSKAKDAEALAQFNARVHSDEGADKPDERVAAWTYDLMTKPHPTFKASDFTIVEDVNKGQIVSTMNLIPQTWTYAGIPFRVGRPELVGTLPEYRNQGLIRRQFEIIHQWSSENGDMVQAITGIPYYYRLFDYEMAMNLHGGRVGFPTHVPRLKEGEAEAYKIRPAEEADIPFLSKLYISGCQRSLVACRRNKAMWKDEISGKGEKNVQRQVIVIIKTISGERVGFFTHPFFTWGDAMAVLIYEITPGFSWREVTPSVIRYLENVYSLYDPEHGTKKPFGAFGFWLGEDHPVYHVIPDSLPRLRKPYAWYLRVSNVPVFLQLISPVLEKRLAESPIAGYSGEVKITFYRGGVRMVLDKGKFTTLEAWKPTPYGHAGDAAFPPHTFLQLLFGYRNLDMLKASFVDCWTDRDEIHVLFDTLFPRQPSNVWPIS